MSKGGAKGAQFPPSAPAEVMKVEVLVIGAGPLGCTFARKLVAGGKSVLLVDSGPQLSPRPGENLKNAYIYQRERDMNRFTNIIAGHLVRFSTPVDKDTISGRDPAIYNLHPKEYIGFQRNGQNPEQNPYYNLPQSAVTYAVGGMFTHWTCSTPRECPGIELSDLLTNEQWDKLYDEAEEICKTSQTTFEYIPETTVPSIRHNVIREALKRAHPNLTSPRDTPQHLPLAGYRPEKTPEFVVWSGGDTILGDDLIKMLETKDRRFVLKPSWHCRRLVRAPGGGRIQYAIVEDIFERKTWHIHASVFCLSAGGVLTPQILYNSDIRPRALGHYISMQIVAFGQVVMLKSLVESIPNDPRWKEYVDQYKQEHPEDPIPIPASDPPPQCWIPFSKDHPWHCQVHKDAFAYGGLQANVDERLVIDMRWFSRTEPRFSNHVKFSDTYKDIYGMPQPTFHFEYSKQDEERAHAMMQDLLHTAAALGGFLPGVEPAFQPPGGAFHLTGSVRMGAKDDGTCVTDTYSRVWGYNNLFLGTLGVIPTATASNPTLTAIALACRSSKYILDNWRTFPPA